jgi:hypothetical protein
MTALYVLTVYFTLFSLTFWFMYWMWTSEAPFNFQFSFINSLYIILKSPFRGVTDSLVYALREKFTFRKSGNFSTTNWYLYTSKNNAYEPFVIDVNFKSTKDIPQMPTRVYSENKSPSTDSIARNRSRRLKYAKRGKMF